MLTHCSMLSMLLAARDTEQTYKILKSLRYQADHLYYQLREDGVVEQAAYDRIMRLIEALNVAFGKSQSKEDFESCFKRLPGKASFFEDMQVEQERFQRNGKNFAIAVLKLDSSLEEFDVFYWALIQILRDTFRLFDSCYAYSGDVVTILLKQTEMAGAEKAMERLYKVAAERLPEFSKEMKMALSSAPYGQNEKQMLNDIKQKLEQYAPSQSGQIMLYEGGANVKKAS